MSQEVLANPNQPEPWLRETLLDIPAVPRAVLHALQLAEEDLWKWCTTLTRTEFQERPLGLPSIAFQLRHIARSIDRLLTYAEGHSLSMEQSALLQSESSEIATTQEVFAELHQSFQKTCTRINAFANTNLEEVRVVGKRKLSTTIGGLLVHIADHTQRHVGQAITTSKVLLARREVQ